MKYIDYFQEYSHLNENTSKSYEKWLKVQHKIIDDHKLNLYFIATFGLSITVFYPMVEFIIKNLTLNVPVNHSDVVLLSITALSILFKESKENVEKLLFLIKEKELSDPFEKVKNGLQLIFNLFKVILNKLGKTAYNLIDLFSYTALLVPFIQIIEEIMSSSGHSFFDTFSNFQNIEGKSFALLIGTLSISAKHLFIYLIKKLKNKIKRFDEI